MPQNSDDDIDVEKTSETDLEDEAEIDQEAAEDSEQNSLVNEYEQAQLELITQTLDYNLRTLSDMVVFGKLNVISCGKRKLSRPG